MNTKIFITDLVVSARIGHLAHERGAHQPLVINVAVWTDITRALESHDLGDTVDYVAIQKGILQLVAEREYVLIESLADDIVSLCFSHARVSKTSVRIEKPNKFPESKSVGIELERER
ncbi:MAG: dihydroneopterin aldolase [bacterium]